MPGDEEDGRADLGRPIVSSDLIIFVGRIVSTSSNGGRPVYL